MIKRLKELRTEFLKLSQEELARKIGLTKSAISDIERGKNSLKDNNLKLICQTFNVNEEWLRNGVGDIFKEDNKKKSLIDIIEEEYNLSTLSKSIVNKYLKLGKKEQAMFEKFVIELFEEYKISSSENNNVVQIPKYTLEEENPVEDELSITELDEVKLYDLPVSAGTGTQLLDDVSYELITIDRRFYPKADFALRVSGDSMEPRFYTGDIIYIESTNDIPNGKIGIFYYNDEVYLKKLEKENGKIYLISLNTKYQPIEVTNDSFKVVGIVL
ncbi:MAG: XRE family transcriptional regulator [Eubacteriales bacterium]|nr:XRE family transcriptional regulator [Eubacteriales bacterium]